MFEGRQGLDALVRNVSSRRTSEALLVAAQVLWYAVLCLLALLGGASLWRRKRADILLLAAVVGVLLLPTLIVPSARMRLPVQAMIHVLAVAGGAAMRSRLVLLPPIPVFKRNIRNRR